MKKIHKKEAENSIIGIFIHDFVILRLNKLYYTTTQLTDQSQQKPGRQCTVQLIQNQIRETEGSHHVPGFWISVAFLATQAAGV